MRLLLEIALVNFTNPLNEDAFITYLKRSNAIAIINEFKFILHGGC
jgi:hypothetical protein